MNKIQALEAAVAHIQNGHTVMVGGFGVPGTPFTLINALLERRCRQLTLIKNEANIAGLGVSKLIEAGCVDRLITSHLGLNSVVLQMMNRGQIEVQFNPQGILAERIRAGGAGLVGVLTDIGIGTELAESKRRLRISDREVVVETALRADVALIHAACADTYGNLVYEKGARNFNPAMATAANLVIAEAEQTVCAGDIHPDHVHTPGAFVDYVVAIDELSPEYGILEDYIFG